MNQDEAAVPWWRRPLSGDIPVGVLAATWVGLSLTVVYHGHLVTGGTLWAHHLAASLPFHPLIVTSMPGSSVAASLLHVPTAVVGLTAFQLGHVLAAAVAVFALTRVATLRDAAHPNLVALVVLTSPAFFAASVASVPGADAAMLVVFATYAIEVKKLERVAGLLLGALGLIRPELLILSLGMAAARRNRTLALWALSLPALHALLCIVFAGGTDWLAAYLSTPALDGPPPSPSASAEALAALVALCPALGLLALLDLRAVSRLERGDALVATLFVATVLALGLGDVGGVGLGPERLLPALPLLAPLVARAVAQLARGEETTVGALVLAAVALLAALPTTPELEPWVVVLAWAAVVLIARVHRPATLVAFVVVSILGYLLVPAARLDTTQQVYGLRQATDFLEQRADRSPHIVTDIPVFRFHAERMLGLDPEDVTFLWAGRAARPILRDGEVPESLLPLLRDHPFGHPLLDPAPHSFVDQDLAVIGDRELQERYVDAPQMVPLLRRNVSIYALAPLSARARAKLSSSPSTILAFVIPNRSSSEPRPCDSTSLEF